MSAILVGEMAAVALLWWLAAAASVPAGVSATPEAEADPLLAYYLPHHHQALYHQHYALCDASQRPACASNTSLSYCLEDEEYPHYDIKAHVRSDVLFTKKYSDVPLQSADDLVEGVDREQEEGFEYSFYSGASTDNSPYDTTHWAGPEGYICPSDVVYATPKRASNLEGAWRVIVNDVHHYTQTARLETCLFPEATCRALPPCYNASCSQKYAHTRLLSWDPCYPHHGLFVDTYDLPSACSCRLPSQ